jgi:hypothetical protein
MRLRLSPLTLYKKEIDRKNQGTSGEGRSPKQEKAGSWLQRQDSNLRPSG